MTPPRPTRIRLRFAKWGRVRFTSHRDVARIFERALRRTSLPVAYSEGFSPRPRLSFGLALATSHESCGEYLDVDFAPGADIDCDALPSLLGAALPSGIEVQLAAPVVPGAPSLQEAVISCSWLVELPGLPAEAADALVERALAATDLPVTRERKGRVVTDDVRPAVLSLRVADPGELPPAAPWQPAGALLAAELAAQPRTCRPGELLAAIDATLEEGRVIRVHQWTQVDGVRREPLPLGAAPARPETAHVIERAS